jgi:hypothetical protein
MDTLAGLARRPTDLRSAAHALRTVADRMFERGDARCAFPDIYGMITDRVEEQANDPNGIFWEPAWISRLSGRFCERYLDTLEWSLAGQAQDCAAWDVAYRCAAQRSTVPFQDVLLGLSAHINFDLAQGISQTIVEFGHARNAEMRARYKHDHDVVNEILQVAIPAAYERLIHAYRCRTSAILFGPARAVTHGMTMRVLAYFRANVWNDVVALLDARTDAERRSILEAMDRRSGRYARTLTAGNVAYASVLARLPRLPRRRSARRERDATAQL